MPSLFCVSYFSVGWHDMREGESTDSRGVCVELNSWYIPRCLTVRNWLALSCLRSPHCTTPPKKNLNSSKIWLFLDIWKQVENFMGNYMKIPVSWVPSKHHKSCCSHLDKMYFRAVVRKVNHKVSLQSPCLLPGRKRPVFYFTSFCSGFSFTEEGIAAYLLCRI